jgi:hypothetical protein
MAAAQALPVLVVDRVPPVSRPRPDLGAANSSHWGEVSDPGRMIGWSCVLHPC